jgi:hypothetical protein
MSYEQAERILERPRIAKTAFRPIKVSILRQLCEAHKIPVVSSRASHKILKADYLKALLQFVSLLSLSNRTS